MSTTREGQALILTILAIGGAIMGATAIAGLLTLYQLRATTDSEKSAQAIFAADTGVNWAFFDYFCGTTSTFSPAGRCINVGEQPFPGPGGNGALTDGAIATTTCYDGANDVTPCGDTTTAASAVSIGTSLTSKRAFTLLFDSESSTAP